MKHNKIDLKEFIPSEVTTVKTKNKYPTTIKDKGDYYKITYITHHHNNSQRKRRLIIQKAINRNKYTFEVLGLLQAEMGKTNNGSINFTNTDLKIMKKVLAWFKTELDIPPHHWHWYIKVNLQKPKNMCLKEKIEDEVINFWLTKTSIDKYKANPKKIVYTKETKNKKLKNKGSLIIEHKNNILSQIIKIMVKRLSYSILKNKEEEIIYFMKGIIAGESCIEDNTYDFKRRVHINATIKEELQLYEDCLKQLGIESKQYQDDKVIISKRKNLVRLLKLRLMTGQKSKYAKFLNMMKRYPNISEETGYFKPKGINSWHRTPQEKIDAIIKLSKEGSNSREVAEKLDLHILKVQRVRKENNLGVRRSKTTKKMQQKIITLHNRLPFMHSYQIANRFNIHVGRVERLRRKNNLRKTLIKETIRKTSFEWIIGNCSPITTKLNQNL